MNTTPMLGSFGNLFGPDLIIVFGLLIVFVVGVVSLVVFVGRRGNSSGVSGPLEERLRQLEALRTTGSITNAEYEEQRRRLLGSI